MIGKRLREARERKGLTLRSVAEAMGVTPQAVSQWERSNPSFSVAKVTAIASFLGVDWKWLEGEHGKDHDRNQEIMRDFERREVPIVDRLQALSFSYKLSAAAFDQTKNTARFIDIGDVKYIQSSEYIGNEGFAFVMDDDCLSPSIEQGDILIFSTRIKPRSGDTVFAVILKGKSSFDIVVDFYNNLADKYEITDSRIQSSQALHNPGAGPDGSLVDGFIFAVAVEHRKLRYFVDK